MNRIFQNLPEFQPGVVWLAGAGPGDPGLLALLALHGMQQADVIVHDSLVSDGVLALRAPHVQLIDVGKRGGKPSCKQSEISQKLVDLARANLKVLRLKGGDPFVFGRGGEEALYLAAHQIPFRIIPGITAGIGGLAYAGIPVTHRACNSVVSFVTGHNLSGEIPTDIPWKSLCDSSPVIVFYMGVKHLGEIVNNLLEGGRASTEPIAFVMSATMPDQMVYESTLGECEKLAEQVALKSPAMMVVGPVVSLRSVLNWWQMGQQ